MNEAPKGFHKKMSIRRCRYLAMLVLFSFLGLYCLVRWSAQMKSRAVSSSRVLQEVPLKQINASPKEEVDSDDRGMYDEIELTEEDLHIAAEKRAALNKFMGGFKRPKDTYKPKPKLGTEHVKNYAIADIGTSTTPRAQANNVHSTIGTSSLEIKNQGWKSAVVAGKQKFGAEILAEPSKIDPPLDDAESPSAKARRTKSAKGNEQKPKVSDQKSKSEQKPKASEQQPKVSEKNPQVSEKKPKVNEQEPKVSEHTQESHPPLITNTAIQDAKPTITNSNGINTQPIQPNGTGQRANGDRSNRDESHEMKVNIAIPSNITKQSGQGVQSNTTKPEQLKPKHMLTNSTNEHKEKGKHSNSAIASRSPKARQPYMSPQVLHQLNHIQSVGQQLFDLQTYMQDDRIYYQYHKNKSSQGNLTEEDQHFEEKREEMIRKANKNINDLNFPESPPKIKHGYPIVFQESNYIPSGNEHERVNSNKAKDKDVKNAQHDIPDREDMPHPRNIILRGDVNAVPQSEQNGYPNVVNKPVYDDAKGNHQMNKNNEFHTNPVHPNAGKSVDVSQMESATSTPNSEPIQTTPLKYEQLTNGDLTVHQVPDSTDKDKGKGNDKGKGKGNGKDKGTDNDKEKQTNATEDKVKDLGNDKDENNEDVALKISKVFIQSVTKTTDLNDTVATVHKENLFQKPVKISRMNNMWQVHDSPHAMYLYSAYYDDRPALDRHKIRIIGIANAEIKNPHCLLWYKNQSTPDIAMTVLTKIGPRIQPLATSANRYEPYIFTCSVIRGKGAPEQVSMVTVKETTPTTLLTVNIPVKPPPGKQIEIGQCMSVVYWNQDPTRVIEWLELNRLWGVGEVTVYADELDDASAAVFVDYADQGLVDFRQMPNILDDDSEFTILLNMSPAINDCMYRNMYRYKKVICTDVDEMIVPRSAANYKEMLEQILAAKGTDHPHPSFMFRNVYFFTDFGPHVEEPWFLHSQRYLKHIKPSEFGYSVKSITDPQACIALQNHLCWKRIKKYDGKDWTIDVPLSLGRNQHYKKCHFDSYLGQLGACDRMMKEYFVDYNIERFGAVLYDRVATKLIQFKIADAMVAQ